MSGGALSSSLQFLLLLGSTLIALKLYSTGLRRQYQIFFAYFVFRVPNSLWPLFLSVHSKVYFYTFVFCEPVVLIFYILLVRELYRLVLKDYSGLQTAGRYIMYLSLAGAVAVSILTLIPKFTPTTPQISQGLGVLAATERGVETALAVFILLLLALLSRYPIQLRRNVRVQATVYSVFFLSSTMAVLVRSVLGLGSIDAVNVAYSIVSVISIFAWLFMLSPAGETAPQRRTGAGAEHEERLLMQLEGLNAALLRVSRQKVG